MNIMLNIEIEILLVSLGECLVRSGDGQTERLALVEDLQANLQRRTGLRIDSGKAEQRIGQQLLVSGLGHQTLECSPKIIKKKQKKNDFLEAPFKRGWTSSCTYTFTWIRSCSDELYT